MSRTDAAASFYTRWATLYDFVERRTPGLGRLRERTVRGMQLDPGMTVLDMGCGPGPNFAPVRARIGANGRMVGLDLSIGQLQRARAHVSRKGWTNVHVARADARDPPVVDPDAVIATFVVGMFDDPATVIDEWCAAVGSGGRIGLLHFAGSDRPYGALPNAVLRGLVLVSTPGKRRVPKDGTTILDRRVRDAHAAVIDRCNGYSHTTHWGGIAHVVTGTVA